jgi:hypothetical protein
MNLRWCRAALQWERVVSGEEQFAEDDAVDVCGTTLSSSKGCISSHLCCRLETVFVTVWWVRPHLVQPLCIVVASVLVDNGNVTGTGSLI